MAYKRLGDGEGRVGDVFAFGPFVLNARTGTLLRDGVPLRVSHRGFGLLVALTREPGRVLTKSQLMDAAWDGAVVEEANLTVQIAGLRKLLGSAPDGGEWIATVQRVGYRFADTGRQTAAPGPQSTSAPNLPSLAVLPFDNFGGVPDQEYFADGVVEDILTALSRFRSFAVVARNSSFAYKGRSIDVREVARDLNVRYVLEGSVRRAGQRLRITAQLIDALSGKHIWADKFDGTIEDVFDVQDRITEVVATIIEPRIREAEIEASRRERPGSVAAYDLYLRGLPLHRAGRQRENIEAYKLFSGATALEPENGLFLVWQMDTLVQRTIMGWPALTANDRALIRELVHRALPLTQHDATVLVRCGNALVQITREYNLGLATLRRALALNPNSVDAMIYAGIGFLHCGDPEEARACFEGAVRLSPNDPYAFIPLTGIAHVEMILGRYEAARMAAEQSMTVSSTYDPAYWMLIAAHAHTGHMDEARAWLEKYRAHAPEATLSRIRAAQPPDHARMGAILSGLAKAGLPD
jgi:TolB-like protein